jgi:hypothetical protein
VTAVVDILLVLLILATLAVTIYAVYKAFSNRDTIWGIGILVAWLIGFGWIVALVYIFAVDRRRSIAS